MLQLLFGHGDAELPQRVIHTHYTHCTHQHGLRQSREDGSHVTSSGAGVRLFWEVLLVALFLRAPLRALLSVVDWALFARWLAIGLPPELHLLTDRAHERGEPEQFPLQQTLLRESQDAAFFARLVREKRFHLFCTDA